MSITKMWLVMVYLNINSLHFASINTILDTFTITEVSTAVIVVLSVLHGHARNSND